jgi:hypothetical protein
MNCDKSGRKCLGYQTLLAFDVDGNRDKGRDGALFKGRPKLKESLAARGIDLLKLSKEKAGDSTNFVIVTTENFERKAKKKNNLQSAPNDEPQLLPDRTAFFQSASLASSLSTNVFASSSNVIERTNTKQTSTSSTASTVISSSNSKEADSTNEFDWNSILWNIDIAQLLPSDENFFINHFMNRLVQLFDNLEDSPFPKLVLKYCEPELAKSCFVTLSSIHLYGYSNDVNDYDQSINQLDIITNELLSLIALNDNEQSVDDAQVPKRDKSPILLILHKLENLPLNLRSSRVITVLILIYVQTMFSILESGRSAISEFLFELGSRICYDVGFRDILVQDEHTKFLVMLIAWFETFTALSSPNVRKSYLRKFGFEGQEQLRLRSEDITGCPDEIFTALLDILDLRFQIYTFGASRDSFVQKQRIIATLFSYRDYVPFEEFHDGGQYSERLLGAQCWSLASLIYIHKLLPEEGYEHTIAALVTEFLLVFPLFEENSDVKKQCIWPLLVVGEMLHLEKDRVKLLEIFDLFYDQNKMGNVRTLQDLLKKTWSQQRSLNSILEGDGWNSSGIALLPL